MKNHLSLQDLKEFSRQTREVIADTNAAATDIENLTKSWQMRTPVMTQSGNVIHLKPKEFSAP